MLSESRNSSSYRNSLANNQLVSNCLWIIGESNLTFWHSVMTLIITQVGVERIHSQAGLASFISTSSLSKTRCVIDCIISVAMTLSLCCKCVAKTFSGQLRSVMKVCKASSFHKTSSDVWHPNRPGSQDSRSKPRWTDCPIELSIRSEIKVLTYLVVGNFCSNETRYEHYFLSNYIEKTRIYYLCIW